MASLCLLDDEGTAASRWEVGARPLAVGRGATADIIVADPALSRRHFIISREGGHYVVKDLQSQNGTFVDGQPATTKPLQPSDCILAGRSVFVFLDKEATATQAVRA
ncbi:MAG TPA: FHA domain-containing protein [Clostridia bacterium]|nr:FHA domain-containing protein [Clostridia bacterium]